MANPNERKSARHKVFLTPAFFLMAACNPLDAAKRVEIADKYFVIPAHFNAVYSTKHQSIRFVLNPETFQVLQTAAPPSEQIVVTVTSTDNNIYGENNFWPDPFSRWRPDKCEAYVFKSQSYEFCSYGTIDAQSWGDTGYSIRHHESGIPLVVIGCVNPDTSNAPNPNCEALGIIDTNIQIRYSFSAHYLPNAFLIDQVIRQIVMHFRNLATEQQNGLQPHSE